MTHPAFAAAERLGPVPVSREQATPEAWVRRYIALSMAAFTAFESEVRDIRPGVPGSRPELGYLVTLAVSAMSAACALTVGRPAVAEELWWLTPEAGALNGEWEEWLTATLDEHGINPADIEPRYTAGDFRSPTAALTSEGA